MINRIIWHLNKKYFFNENQYGFSKGKNTTMAIKRVMDFIRRAKLNEQHTAVVSVDFKGAFDHAWRPAILHVLKLQNCPKTFPFEELL